MGNTMKLAAVFLITIFVAACSRWPDAKPVDSAAAETDAEYRFVVLSPAIAVMLVDLGFEDQIVGKHAWDMVLSDSVPAVGSQAGVDYESLLRANPTHVFFQRTTNSVPARVEAMAKEHGWVVVTIPLDTLDDIAVGADDLYMRFVGVRDLEADEIDPSARFAEVRMPSEALARAWSDLGPIADRAGRVLVLGSVEPPGAMGPGSFHVQLIERLGATPAIVEGGMWQELDFEDLVRLNPDSIILFSPRVPDESDLFAPVEALETDVSAYFGKIGELEINAVCAGRLAVIDDPLGLLPSTSFGKIGERVAEVLRRWALDSEP